MFLLICLKKILLMESLLICKIPSSWFLLIIMGKKIVLQDTLFIWLNLWKSNKLAIENFHFISQKITIFKSKLLLKDCKSLIGLKITLLSGRWASTKMLNQEQILIIKITESHLFTVQVRLSSLEFYRFLCSFVYYGNNF